MNKIVIATVTAAIAVGVIGLKFDFACQYSPIDISWINECSQTTEKPENEKQLSEDALENKPDEQITDIVSLSDTEQTAEADAVSKNKEFMPSFDIARVEADGSTLVAGRGAPNSRIVLLKNGVDIGETMSNSTGEWVILLDDPVKDASTTLSLIGFLPDGTAIESDSGVVIATAGVTPVKVAAVKEILSETITPIKDMIEVVTTNIEPALKEITAVNKIAATSQVTEDNKTIETNKKIVETQIETSEPMVVATEKLAVVAKEVTEPLVVIAEKTIEPLAVIVKKVVEPMVVVAEKTTVPMVIVGETAAEPMAVAEEKAAEPIVVAEEKAAEPLEDAVKEITEPPVV
ncbi:MAG: hypothetical protein HRU28_14630, partial [Rhizobiales bacterium]|nr:hypothetical protein [Hyphomicrobiales bacterium]